MVATLIDRTPLETSQGLTFSHQFPIIISCFSWTVPGRNLFILCWFYKETVEFSNPSKSNGILNGAPNRKWRQKLIILMSALVPAAFL